MTEENRDECPIVGIGASAGGLEALSELVKAIPERSGLAYVVIQHLAPDHPSIMDQLLSSHSAIPVVKIEENQNVEPDTVYVLPAGPSATIEGAQLHLHERDEEATLRTPIDQFLESLASARGRSAFAVILSGTGSDGTVGVRAIKHAGGFAIVQKSDSARFPGMPDSAAATGLVDFVLRPSDIPARLVEINEHRHDMLSKRSSEELQEEIGRNLKTILSTLAEEDGQDFSDYKPGTLIRRIERRMTLLRENNTESFIETLKNKPKERSQLLQDFLIGVTRFFRDEQAFEKLRKLAIEPLFDKGASSFRIWVPGCATGEEAYSIAMLFAEANAERGEQRQWQIFGTDIDGASLAHARAGFYSESQLEGVSEERLEKFFTKQDNGYQVSARLREQCIFAPHNLLQDPPFSRLDLISCRNLLIYLTGNIQKEVIPRFHYALNENGFLLLGPSESLSDQTQYFDTLDRETRLFQRNDDTMPTFSSLVFNRDEPRKSARSLPAARLNPAGGDVVQETSFEQQLLSYFARQSAPPFACINANDEINYISERMGEYIKPTQGMPSAAIDQFLVRDLRMPVRALIDEARESGVAANTQNVIIAEVGETHIVDLEAAPLPFRPEMILLTLQPVRTQDLEEITGTVELRDDAERDLIERELATTRQKLTKTLNSYETTEQELKSSNEELLSMNEELQSSNEELETSREELQSINEELETVNAELSENNRQLLSANSDLKNLFDSTDIATVFLDVGLRVRRYTPASQRLFGIQDRDIGRSINDLKWRVSYDDLEEDAERVLDTLQPIEREVEMDGTGETFLMRIRPYRRVDNRIDGIVLTLFDITARKGAESQLRKNAQTLGRQYAELESLYDTTPVGLNLLDRELRYLRINERLAEINGFPVEDHIGRRQNELLPEIDEKVREAQMSVLETGEPLMGIEVSGSTPAQPGKERHWIVDYYPVRTVDGEVFAVGSCVNEVTEQKQLQHRLEAVLKDLSESEERLNFALEVGQLGAWDYDFATEVTERTELHDAIFGHDEPLSEWNFDLFLEYAVEEERPRVKEIFDRATREAVPYEIDCRIVRADGKLRQIHASGRPRFAQDGTLEGFVGTVADVTDRRNAELRQSLLLHELQHRVKNTLAAILAIVRFSSKKAGNVDQFTRTFRDRLLAIARTHDLLSTEDWQGGELRKVIEQEISPYTETLTDRLSFEGDNPMLSAGQMLALTLAFHELTTNAVKYGALSVESGKVRVTSAIEEGQNLVLEWKELDGPNVAKPPPGDTGFGSFLLEQVLGPDLEGSTEVFFEEDGLRWTARFPLEIEQARAE